MSADPSAMELIAVLLTAVLLALPLALPLVACVIAAPPRAGAGRARQRTTIVAIGASLLVGILVAAASTVVLSFAMRGLASAVGIILGLLGAMVAAVLAASRPAGSAHGTALGLVGGVLIGLSEPGQALPALFGLTQSPPVVFTAVVLEAVLLIALTVVLAIGTRRVAGLRLGVVVGALAAGILLLVGAASMLVHEIGHIHLPAPPVLVTLAVVAVAVVVGTVVGSARDRGPARRDHSTAPEHPET